MSTLNVIGEFLEGWEQSGQRASARELTIALADTAPRGCASALLIASNSEAPEIDHPKARVEVMSLHSSMIPLVWRGGPAARPLDGEFVHSLSPLIPLRQREEADGSQTTVTVPHTLAWDAPDVLPKGQAKQLRQHVKRAVKHADVILTPTHAVAERLREIYGAYISVQVLPLAAPREYLAPKNIVERLHTLGMPEHYFVSTAYPGETGRLEWILRTLEANPDLPPLVLVGPGAEADLSSWPVLADRVHQVMLTEESGAEPGDIGAIIAGARALVLPQVIADCLLPIHGALNSGVPIVHGGAACMAETALDGATAGENEESFAEALTRVARDDEERARLSVLAQDRSRMFSWRTTAWQLWEVHANI
ncbi:mannosyltransferase [Leucobacter chinensis]|uniref:mannosyltransferase n=1 Tax=Leucobacter chinensis TaxID=2851010 RepID=UPI001C24975A|nr:mannosyltransferase [Leucobacter chinensis]